MASDAAAETAVAASRRPPVRTELLPYGRQTIDEDDIAAVVAVLRSDFLTTGPAVEAFEHAFAEFCGATAAVAVSSGTAGLHAAMHALGVGPGDEVIVPPMTFAATANCVVYQGATPVFADVDPDTLLIDPAEVTARITPRTRAVIAVDYAGQPCDYDALRAVTDRHGLALVADACHSVGALYRGRSVGTLADLNVFSFHPVKHLTTGEGGMITTSDRRLAERMRVFRNHGITTDHRQRAEAGAFYYEMTELGFNYRITDFQCALGTSQLRRLPEFVAARKSIAQRYDTAFAQVPEIKPLALQPDVSHAYHLYPVLLELGTSDVDRSMVFSVLRREGIGVNVHYVPVHLHPYYRERFSTGPGQFPVAEAAFERLLSLPIFPAMSEHDVVDVADAVRSVTAELAP